MKLNLSREEKKILDAFGENMLLSSTDLTGKTGFGKDKVLIILKNLIEKSYVERLGRGRGTKYKLL